jgi:hypothetical protein
MDATNKEGEKEEKKIVDSTPHCSRVVPHPSTEQAQTALTSVFGWEPVHYGWYGRIRQKEELTTEQYMYSTQCKNKHRD